MKVIIENCKASLLLISKPLVGYGLPKKSEDWAALFSAITDGQVFIYHNGADSYYVSTGFWGVERV